VSSIPTSFLKLLPLFFFSYFDHIFQSEEEKIHQIQMLFFGGKCERSAQWRQSRKRREGGSTYKKASSLSIIIDRPHTHKRGGGRRRRERKLFFFLVFIFIEGEKSQSPIIWRHIFHRRGVVAGRNAIDYRNYLKKKRPEKYRKLNWS
jgi:hypothetical protein